MKYACSFSLPQVRSCFFCLPQTGVCFFCLLEIGQGAKGENYILILCFGQRLCYCLQYAVISVRGSNRARTVLFYRFREFPGWEAPLFIRKFHRVDGRSKRTHDLCDFIIFFIPEYPHNKDEFSSGEIGLNSLPELKSRGFIVCSVKDEDGRFSDTGKSSRPESTRRACSHRFLADGITISLKPVDNLEGGAQVIGLVSPWQRGGILYKRVPFPGNLPDVF